MMARCREDNNVSGHDQNGHTITHGPMKFTILVEGFLVYITMHSVFYHHLLKYIKIFF